MQVKLLHDLVEEMAGENTGRIVEILFGKKDVNEFLIAKKMDLTINQVRNILYKLSAEGLVTFIRKKDKRKGWYIYYWTLKTEKCLVKLEDSLVKKIEGLNHILDSRQTRRFYVCNSCAIEVGEEKALEHGFSCEECAEVYELSENSDLIRNTKSKITKTEKDLELIRSELLKLRDKLSKKRDRVNKKIEKEEGEKKTLLKIARAAARAKLRDDEKRTTGKKKDEKKKVLIKKGAEKVVSKKKVMKKNKSLPRKKVVKKKSLVSKLRKRFSGRK